MRPRARRRNRAPTAPLHLAQRAAAARRCDFITASISASHHWLSAAAPLLRRVAMQRIAVKPSTGLIVTGRGEHAAQSPVKITERSSPAAWSARRNRAIRRAGQSARIVMGCRRSWFASEGALQRKTLRIELRSGSSCRAVGRSMMMGITRSSMIGQGLELVDTAAGSTASIRASSHLRTPGSCLRRLLAGQQRRSRC